MASVARLKVDEQKVNINAKPEKKEVVAKIKLGSKRVGLDSNVRAQALLMHRQNQRNLENICADKVKKTRTPRKNKQS